MSHIEIPTTEAVVIEIVEQIHNFQIQVFANETHIILNILLPKSGRQIQLPFGRLDFIRFLREMNTAAERSIPPTDNA